MKFCITCKIKSISNKANQCRKCYFDIKYPSSLTEITCSGCRKVLPLNRFVKSKQSKIGVTHCCKECTYARHNKYMKDNGKYNGAWFRRRCRKFGISQEEFIRLIHGTCEICGIHYSHGKAILYIDHNHKTDKMRGVLCHLCNAGLGMFTDNKGKLLSAIKYLESKEEC